MANDYSSIYNIKDFILNDISPKYYNIKDISLLNSGLYGMINDISSTIAEDTMRVTSRYISEQIPGQAKMPEFIYAHAANYGVTDVFATCATCQAVLFIKEQDVLNHGIIDGRYTEYTIDSDLVVYIDNVPFSLPSDIKIRSNFYGGRYNHRCYWATNMRNSLVKGDLPYIKCARTKITNGNVNYIALNVTLYQYMRQRTSENIITNTTLNIPYFDIPFENSICNFEVMYKPPNGSVVQLNKILSNSAPTTSPFIYYALQGDNTLRLSFSNDDRYFTPEYNASLEIFMYETIGSKGSFPLYEGDNIFVAPKSEDSSISYNNEIPLFASMMTASVGGKDAYTLEEINMLTVQKQVTVDSITTENDLMLYLNTYTSLYGTATKPIKIRDDFVDRIYSCYVRLSDDNNIYPTNNLNIDLTLDKLGEEYDPSESKIVIPAGVRLGYLGDSIDYLQLLNDDDPHQDMEYTTVGLTVIDKEETTIASYMNSIDKNIMLSYTYVNDDSLFQFIAKYLNVKRDAALGDNTYTFNLAIASTDLTVDTTSNVSNDLQDDYSGSENFEPTNDDEEFSLNIDNIKVFMFIGTNEGHYIEMTKVADDDSDIDNATVFTCKLSTDDIMAKSNIKLYGLKYCINHQLQECYTAMENPPIKFLVFYDEGNKPGHEYSELIPDSANYTLCNILSSNNNDLYFAYPLNLIRPTLEFKPSLGNGQYNFFIRIHDMPVIGRDFLLNEDNLEPFLARLNHQHDFLDNLLITSNFAIYMRFFNTYGRSRIFTITNGQLLNKVNCSLSLGIHFNNGVVVEDYINEIKLTIKDYVESVNYLENSTGINTIKLSLLSKKIHDTYSTIVDYIVMGSINGYDSNVQSIIMDKDLSAKENLGLIPEFLTIDVNDINITIL